MNLEGLELTHRPDEIPFLHQESTISTPSRNSLRTTQIEIYGITTSFQLLRTLQPLIFVIRTELDDERSVERSYSFD